MEKHLRNYVIGIREGDLLRVFVITGKGKDITKPALCVMLVLFGLAIWI